MVDEGAAEKVRNAVGSSCRVFSGNGGLLQLIDECGADMVLTSLVGAAGIEPTLRAIARGMDIALANKETLVAAGELVMKEAARKAFASCPSTANTAPSFSASTAVSRKKLKNC